MSTSWWEGLAPLDGVLGIQAAWEPSLGALASADELAVDEEEIARLRQEGWSVVRATTPPTGERGRVYRVGERLVIGTPRLLVKFKEAPRGKLGKKREARDDREARERVLRDHRLLEPQRLHRGLALYEVRIDDGRDPFDVARLVATEPAVEFAEPVAILPATPQARPSNARFVRQWHLRNGGGSVNLKLGADIDAERAWEVTRGAGSRIAMIDRGFDLWDPAIVGAVADESAYFSGGAYSRNPNLYPYVDGHGTNCARAAVASWGRHGPAGIAPGASILLVATKLSTSDICKALVYAANPPAEDPRLPPEAGADCIAVVFNINLNSSSVAAVNAFINTVDPKVTSLVGARQRSRFTLGVPVFWAASNSGGPDPVLTMADVIGVGGSDGLDLAAGSGVGPQLEFLAPATEIECGTISGGASMATSIAAAVAALVVSVNPLLTRHEILRILRSTCEKIGPDAYVSERNAKCGWGRVNAAAAVHMAKVMRNRMGVDSPNV